jgi:spermidine synthase
MFLSGAAALLFETLWFRQAGLMLGNSVWSTSLVTASFMGGLALGNGAVARWGPELRRPVALYALLEATIGATGLGVVLLFPALTKVLLPLFRLALDRPELLNGMRPLAALLVLLVPATAMGATLRSWFGPCLFEIPTSGRCSAGSTDGTPWERSPALAGEMVLIERLGVSGSAIAAAALNGTAALIAMALARRAMGVARRRRGGPGPPLTARGLRLLLAAFLCGGILLGLEVLWFRFLLLFVLASSLTFAIMLAVVLSGIAGGGLVAAFWMRRRHDVAAFVPLLALAAGVATVLTYASFVQSLPQAGNSYYTTDRNIALRAIHLMLPVSFVSGLLFSLLGKCLQAETGGDARAAGLLTLANTVGEMLGGLLAGFLLLPVLGIERSLCVLAVAYGGVALAAARAAPGKPAATDGPHGARRGAFAAVTALFPFGHRAAALPSSAAARWTGDGARVVAAREGLTETIQYLRKDLWASPSSIAS